MKTPLIIPELWTALSTRGLHWEGDGFTLAQVTVGVRAVQEACRHIPTKAQEVVEGLCYAATALAVYASRLEGLELDYTLSAKEDTFSHSQTEELVELREELRKLTKPGQEFKLESTRRCWGLMKRAFKRLSPTDEDFERCMAVCQSKFAERMMKSGSMTLDPM